MYSTCLFCHRPLGANEVVEHFPIGRRLAYDPAKGRLWVVCPRCTRWNLTPLEERWEAIEELERLFRNTKLRASTEHVGLARGRDGLTMIRVGAPQRPEMAAWRYGDTFAARRTRLVVTVGAVVVVGGVAVATGAFALLKAALPGAGAIWQVPNYYNIYRETRKVHARTTDERGRPIVVRGKHLGSATLIPASNDDGGWSLRVAHDRGTAELHGEPAQRVAGTLFATFNQRGAWRSDVARAVSLLEERGGPRGALERAARAEPAPQQWGTGWRRRNAPPGSMRALPLDERLALEMALHEESERRALEGELATLEAAWREAEEIAAIADNLLLPDGVEQRIDAAKERS